MKIAIVGAGVSGLVAAHLLHRGTRSRCSRPAPTPAATRTRSRVDTADETLDVDTGFIVFNDRNYPRFERLLAELGRRVAAVDMSFGVSDGRATSSTRAPRPTGCSPSARTSSRRGSTAWSPTCARFNRAARELLGSPATTPSLGALARASALLARVRRAADRPAGVRRVVGRSASRCGRSRRASWPSSSTTTGCSASAAGRSGGRSAAARARYVEALIAAVRATGSASPRRSRAIERRPDDVRVDAARRRARALRRGRASPTHSDQALRDARATRPTPSTRSSARSPTSPTRRSCTPTRACCRGAGARGRAGTTTCSSVPAGATTVTYHMNRLQSLSADARVLRDAQPHRGDRPGAGHAHDQLRPSRSSPRTAPARRRATPRSAARNRTHYCGAYWGWGFHEDGVASAAARRRDELRRRGAVSDVSALRGHGPPPPLRSRARTSSATGSRWPTSTSTSCRRCSAAAAGAGARRSCASAARDYLGDPGGRWRGRARRGRRHTGARPTARSGCSPTCARSATASTRSASTTASTARRAAAGASSPR